MVYVESKLVEEMKNQDHLTERLNKIEKKSVWVRANREDGDLEP